MSFNTLKLVFLTEEVYLINCMIYYKNINTKNHNNSNNILKNLVNTSILFKTAYLMPIVPFICLKLD